MQLVHRAIGVRGAGQADLALQRYRSRAEGVVVFLAQIGADPAAPPHLIKGDQLAVEVYWQAPDRSKQNVTAWRDRRWLPTDIRYHRDHLGIVTNDFGDRIRLGEGDEVRDVVHPLSPDGPGHYDYALGSSLTLRTPGGTVTVREVTVRPRDAAAPLVAGSLYLDDRSGVLVRFRFGFTRAAYLQPGIEDISVLLESALFDQRSWLPWRQEIEIRRRTVWLEVPFRTIIRGRWTIGDYELDVDLPGRVFAGGPYGGLRAPRADDSTWAEPLDAAVSGLARGADRADPGDVRREVLALVSSAAVTRPPARLAFGSFSDLARVNRVQGLALGLGLVTTPGRGRVELAGRVRYGTSDRRVTGGGGVSLRSPAWDLELFAGTDVRDLDDIPVISGVLNSFLAQEGGNDHGDWVWLERVAGRARWRAGSRVELHGMVGRDWTRSLETTGRPARGAYRANPPLGAGESRFLAVGARYRSDPARPSGVDAAVVVEAGASGRAYRHLALNARTHVPLAGGLLRTRILAGAATREIPPWRTFALGGRGTLPGEGFRAFGGRHRILARLDWEVEVPFPDPGLGDYPATGGRILLSPFVAAGWAEAPPPGLPWQPTRGLRPVVGVASELLFGMIRLEAGWALCTGRVGLSVDASPGWWPLL